MPKKKSSSSKGDGVVPKDFAQTPPRNLYNTSDIRFVMLEIGKLTSSVDRLIKDVETQGGKLDKLNHQASFLKGGIAVTVVIVSICTWVLDQKWDNVTHLLKGNQNDHPAEVSQPIR